MEKSEEHQEQTCSTCKYFSMDEDFYTCECGQQQLFKTTMPHPESYCVFHEPLKEEKK